MEEVTMNKKLTKAEQQLVDDMKNALAFVTKYQGWQSYNARDTRTVKAIAGLHKLGLIEEATTSFRLTPVLESTLHLHNFTEFRTEKIGLEAYKACE